MEKWGWSENEVKNFLDLLKNDNMIIKTSNKKDYYNNSKLRDLPKFKSHKKTM